MAADRSQNLQDTPGHPIQLFEGAEEAVSAAPAGEKT